MSVVDRWLSRRPSPSEHGGHGIPAPSATLGENRSAPAGADVAKGVADLATLATPEPDLSQMSQGLRQSSRQKRAQKSCSFAPLSQKSQIFEDAISRAPDAANAGRAPDQTYKLTGTPEDWRDIYEERVAIREFDGGAVREVDGIPSEPVTA